MFNRKLMPLFLAGGEMHTTRTFLTPALPRRSAPSPRCATGISTWFRTPTGAFLTAGRRSDRVAPQGKEAKRKRQDERASWLRAERGPQNSGRNPPKARALGGEAFGHEGGANALIKCGRRMGLASTVVPLPPTRLPPWREHAGRRCRQNSAMQAP